ncbi:uncharacterized protein LOC143290515 [Babylonia areolata]|uniref:uncharacterized protein LOC143290515 n=1 Tax=Babylonia areolata TaxID=304850 RepID=UPI003FD5126A
MSDTVDTSRSQKIERILSDAKSLRDDLLKYADILDNTARAATIVKVGTSVASMAGPAGRMLSSAAWALVSVCGFLASVADPAVSIVVKTQLEDKWKQLLCDLNDLQKDNGVNFDTANEMKAIAKCFIH